MIASLAEVKLQKMIAFVCSIGNEQGIDPVVWHEPSRRTISHPSG
jgi:hypothetical protein